MLAANFAAAGLVPIPFFFLVVGEEETLTARVKRSIKHFD
jgi:hypothetical protein